jgi:putative hydrolase of the HAD superfamily
MIKAVIFDCFGVLATDDWLPFKQAHFGHDPELFQHAGDINQQSNAGFISFEQFVQEIADMAGVSTQEVQKVLRSNTPNEELFAYIRELKPKYKIGMLSNSSSNWLSEIFTAEQIALFDSTILSYMAHTAKPDPRIYELSAEDLQVEIEECVFTDDQERYATAARDVGMQGIAYKGFEQFKADLEKILA